MTAELWHADAADEPGRRILDVGSAHHHYGRLAVLDDPGVGRTSTDDLVLRLFTQYAANALDVFTILTAARRSDSTARTILSFSEQLSGLTNLAQALQILADTVPDVTGCAQATVYLWDKENSQLVLGAYTTGMAPPERRHPRLDRPPVVVGPVDHAHPGQAGGRAGTGTTLSR